MAQYNFGAFDRIGNARRSVTSVTRSVTSPAKGVTYARQLTCQFILNDERPPLWCGQPAQTGSVYCEEHHKLCHIRRYIRDYTD